MKNCSDFPEYKAQGKMRSNRTTNHRKMTPHIRIHKDFTVQWGIFRKSEDAREEYNLEGKELVLQLQSPYRTENITDFTVRGNIIEWTYWGKDQKSLGS